MCPQRREVAGRARGDPATQRRELERLREVAKGQPVVAQLGLGPRVVNQGPLSVGYVTDMLIAWTGDGHCVRRLQCRFLAQVLEGDRLSAGGEVSRVERRFVHFAN